MSQQIYNLSFELEVVKTKKEINTNDIVSQNKMWIRILFFLPFPYRVELAWCNYLTLLGA